MNNQGNIPTSYTADFNSWIHHLKWCLFSKQAYTSDITI